MRARRTTRHADVSAALLRSYTLAEGEDGRGQRHIEEPPAVVDEWPGWWVPGRMTMLPVGMR
jgi:hypothetical protein